MTNATLTKTAKSSLLTEDDVELLLKREGLKAELKRLDALLNPKIERTIDECGCGRYAVGNRQVELSETLRENCSWKQVCYAVATEEAINRAKPEFTGFASVKKAVVVL